MHGVSPGPSVTGLNLAHPPEQRHMWFIAKPSTLYLDIHIYVYINMYPIVHDALYPWEINLKFRNIREIRVRETCPDLGSFSLLGSDPTSFFSISPITYATKMPKTRKKPNFGTTTIENEEKKWYRPCTSEQLNPRSRKLIGKVNFERDFGETWISKKTRFRSLNRRWKKQYVGNAWKKNAAFAK